MPRLFVLTGDDLGKTFDVLSGCVLGRGKEVEVTLHAVSISRRHARLEWRGGSWCIEDLGSSNGTFVAGKRVQDAQLVDGHTFRLGDVELRFRDDESDAALRAAPAVAAQDEGAFELEGEWVDATVKLPPLTAEASGAAPVRPGSPDLPGSPAPGRSAQARAKSPAASARDEVLKDAARRAGTSRSTDSGGRILQYNRHEGSGGLFSGDLSQQPLGTRLAVYLALALIFLGLAWGAFSLTRGMRASGAAADDFSEMDE